MNSIPILKRSIKNIRNIALRRPAVLFSNVLLTRRCTQRCLHCSIPFKASEDDHIYFENYRLLLDRLESYGAQVITLSGGEPMLHPQLEDCVDYALKKKFARVHLLTTLYGSDKMVDKTIELILKTGVSMSLSFDGFGDIADKLRGGKDVAKKVTRAMEILHRENQKRKKSVKTGVNVVVSKLNLSQIPDILGFLEGFGWPTDVDLYRWRADNQREIEELKLEDSSELRQVLARVKQSPIVFTPEWLIDGFPAYLNGGFVKRCPYLDSPATGSKFFFDVDGGVKVCIGEAVGNIFKQTLPQVFRSQDWQDRLLDFKNCPGCWNTCYTPSARIFSYERVKDLVKAMKVIKN